MDPGALGVMIPIVAIAAWGAVKIASIQANARALGNDPQVARRLAAMEDEIAMLRQELSETQERIDFAERLLAQKRPDRLDAPQ
jgi:alkylation response protein AidB-like acyl-CoA dehydrogenase